MPGFENAVSLKTGGVNEGLDAERPRDFKCFGLGPSSTVFDLFYFDELVFRTSPEIILLCFFFDADVVLRYTWGGVFFSSCSGSFLKVRAGDLCNSMFTLRCFSILLTVSDVLVLCSFFLFFGFFWLSVLLHVALPMPVDSRGTFVIL